LKINHLASLVWAAKINVVSFQFWMLFFHPFMFGYSFAGAKKAETKSNKKDEATKNCRVARWFIFIPNLPILMHL
jgi:hypothetical protein